MGVIAAYRRVLTNGPLGASADRRVRVLDRRLALPRGDARPHLERGERPLRARPDRCGACRPVHRPVRARRDRCRQVRSASRADHHRHRTRIDHAAHRGRRVPEPVDLDHRRARHHSRPASRRSSRRRSAHTCPASRATNRSWARPTARGRAWTTSPSSSARHLRRSCWRRAACPWPSCSTRSPLPSSLSFSSGCPRNAEAEAGCRTHQRRTEGEEGALASRIPRARCGPCFGRFPAWASSTSPTASSSAAWASSPSSWPSTSTRWARQARACSIRRSASAGSSAPSSLVPSCCARGSVHRLSSEHWARPRPRAAGAWSATSRWRLPPWLLRRPERCCWRSPPRPFFNASSLTAVRGRTIGTMDTAAVIAYAIGAFLVPVLAAAQPTPVLVGLGTIMAVSGVIGVLLLGRYAVQTPTVDPVIRKLADVAMFAGLPAGADGGRHARGDYSHDDSRRADHSPGRSGRQLLCDRRRPRGGHPGERRTASRACCGRWPPGSSSARSACSHACRARPT